MHWLLGQEGEKTHVVSSSFHSPKKYERNGNDWNNRKFNFELAKYRNQSTTERDLS